MSCRILKSCTDRNGEQQCAIRQEEDGRLYINGMVTFETVSELSGAAAEMSKAAETMFCKEGVVTVDLREVEKADSAGLALLIDWMRQAKQHEHEIEYVNIPQQMMAIARVSGLDKVLPLTWD